MYYDEYAQAFIDATREVDMRTLYTEFLPYIPQGGIILDLGCGSGRDTLYFKQQGYAVEAIDYSIEMVKFARDYTGVAVRQESFYALNQQCRYDGIWACASLLHSERQKLPNVFKRIVTALKVDGYAYLSFKYGCTDRSQNGRFFTDLNEEQLLALLQPLNVQCIKLWITCDKRIECSTTWLNVIFKKKNECQNFMK